MQRRICRAAGLHAAEWLGGRWSAHPEDTLDNRRDGGVGVGAGPCAGGDSARPGSAQRGSLGAQPGVAQQCARVGAALRVLLEAGQQEVRHVQADAVRQARVLILYHPAHHPAPNQRWRPPSALLVFGNICNLVEETPRLFPLSRGCHGIISCV